MNNEDKKTNNFAINGKDGKMNIFNAPVYGIGLSMNNIEIIQSFREASALIRDYRSIVADNFHIERPVTTELFDWLKQDNTDIKEHVCALLGNAGQGKTVVMRDLLLKLEKEKIPTLAIKADAFALDNSSLLKSELGLRIEVIDAIRQLSESNNLVVLIIDQIDALSMSLSNDRSPLNTYNRLIHIAASIVKVKVVLSCRSFDWDYDSMLSGYRRFSNTFHINDLTLEDVYTTLERIGEDYHTKQKQLLDFLRTPLHLYLYCSLHEYVDTNEDVTLNALYNILWTKVVLSKEGELNNVKCLKLICQTMYSKQVLRLSSNFFETKFYNEKNYLASNNFLNEEGKLSPMVQFIHQSLFDYVYARLYFESDKSLIDDILKEHQGLFVRSRIKQYFQYLRDVDKERYINELIAFLINSDIRFHIKHLIITWLGYLPTPSKQDLQLAEQYILPIETYHNILVNSARSATWFNFITEKDNLLKKVIAGNQTAIAEAQAMFLGIGHDNSQSDCLTNFLSFLVDSDSESAHMFVSNNFAQINNFSSPILKSLFEKINKKNITVSALRYLEHILPEYPQLIAEYLEKIFITKTQSLTCFDHDFVWDYDIDYLFEKLCVTDWQIATRVTLHNIERLSNQTAYTPIINGINLKISAEFYYYEQGGDYIKTPEKWVNFVRKQLKEANIAELSEFVDFLKESKQVICKLILADLYNNRIANYYHEALQLITDLDVLNCSEGIMQFYLYELLKKVFAVASDYDRHTIINVLKLVNPPGEDSSHKSFYPGGPINCHGYTRGGYYFALGKENLRTYDHEAYKEFQEILRRYPYINNNRPERIRIQSGWRGIKQTALNLMSDEDIIINMRKIKNSITADFDKPTPEGVAMQLKEMAVKDYDRFKNLLEMAFTQNIEFVYKYKILLGLMDSPYAIPTDITIFFQRLFAEVMSIPELSASHTISLIRCSDFYTKKKYSIPQSILNFICDIAAEYDDTNNSPWNDNEEDLFNTGINQVRGCAAENLVGFFYDEKALPQIIDALNRVAETGTPPTRCAMMLNLGLLGTKDIKAMTSLYIKAITKDFHHSLLHIPLHEANPLIVLISDHFQLIESLLWDIINGDYPNEEFSTVCWLSWLWGNPSCKDMLLSLLAKNHKARLNWLSFVSGDMPYNNKQEYIIVINRILPYIDKELTLAFEGHFANISKVITEWNNLESICNNFVQNQASAYVDNVFLEFIEHETILHPQKCLEWIIQLIDNVLTEGGGNKLPRLIDLMINAYNTIRTYNKGNEFEEFAMNKFDQLLSDTSKNKNIILFLTKLDE